MDLDKVSEEKDEIEKRMIEKSRLNHQKIN